MKYASVLEGSFDPCDGSVKMELTLVSVRIPRRTIHSDRISPSDRVESIIRNGKKGRREEAKNSRNSSAFSYGAENQNKKRHKKRNRFARFIIEQIATIFPFFHWNTRPLIRVSLVPLQRRIHGTFYDSNDGQLVWLKRSYSNKINHPWWRGAAAAANSAVGSN